MIKASILVGLTILAAFASAQQAPCPLQNQIGSLISARVIVAQQQSLVSLVQGTDTQCYNYSLPYSFTSVPDVAVAVHDFQSKTTNDLFFSIKPIETESLAYVPFLIRTHWKYTAWTKIAFSFLAEDRTDLESGYYQVDTGVLGGCEPGKNIQVLLPYRQMGLQPGNINHKLFLHGFEISVQKYNASSLSPFEVQIADSSSNTSGIAVLISVTTVTQVNSLHISYLAWSATTLQMVTGSFVYEMLPSYEIAHTPTTNIGRNYARLHGISGFIINHNSQAISLSTTWTGNKFIFDLGTSQRLTHYFTFEYVFFIGSECSDCPGYIYSYNGRCVSFCPAGSYPTAEKTCIECGEGYFWDGSKCSILCPDGQFLNIATNKCQCPAGLNWTGKACIACSSGRQFQNSTLTCECPVGTRWNGFGCAKADPCTNGKEWDIFTFTCKCPIGTTWNGTFCFKPTTCRGGQYLDENYKCVCPQNFFFKDGVCQATGCNGGQIWNGTECVCETGFNWNGSICLLCINGQSWDSRTRSCRCEEGYQWNGNFCEKYITCSGGRIFNREYDQCLCPDKNYWNGAQCLQKPQCCCGQRWNEATFKCDCPEGFNWDGKACVVCTAGKTWDSIKKVCVCPPGTQWNNQFCTVIENCRGGMIWNQNTWACQCPSVSVWNGNYCISNPCRNGKVWDNFSKKCICIGNYQDLNGTCVPPEIFCTYGRILNLVTLTCECPAGTWDSKVSCDQIPTCTSNKIYDPQNNQCICQPGYVYLSSKDACGDPTCPQGQRWNGIGCVDIACPPNSYFNGTECICPDPADLCLPWEIFNGFQCVYFQDTCPRGTRWNGTSCISNGECPAGFYKDEAVCKPLPQRCVPPTTYSNGKCLSGAGCPFGSYKTGSSCTPYNKCEGDQVWNSDLVKCVCPEGTGWNGVQCVICGAGQVWDLYEGCTCRPGYFFKGNQCDQPDRDRCSLIPNAKWNSNDNNCQCNPGFTVVGYQCICKDGVPYEHYCDRCAHRPHSTWRFGMCQCDNGYTLYGTQCLPNQNDGTSTQADCSVGTFFDSQQKKCLSCPAGCLSCSDSYTCEVCSVDFIYDDVSKLCIERCGDGRRYVRECDDGNPNSGDGCDISCRIEPGFQCRGGSPNSADICSIYNPSEITFIQTGQIRYAQKIVLNIKADYIPASLLQSTDCTDRCSQILDVRIISGQTAARTKYSFISGTRFGFAVEFEFDRSYIAAFNVEIRIKQSLGSRYFPGINISNPLSVSINPAFLSRVSSDILV